MKPMITWILIADGGQARVFEHTGPGKGLVPVKGFSMEDDHVRARDIVTDRPGRGGAGGNFEPRTNPVEQREAVFVKNVAEKLNRHCSDGDFQRLVIAAAPVALGEIRPYFSAELKKAILAEVPKDLTNIPMAKLPAHFEDVLPV
jgi:protein required for attachment to host cells